LVDDAGSIPARSIKTLDKSEKAIQVMEPAVKERPILFSGAMVRAILAGQKTQTRRIIKGNGTWSVEDDGDGVGRWWPGFEDENGEWCKMPCPYGDVGERLWVRETHYVERAGYQDGTDRFILYKATDDYAPVSKWTPSIHMPRFASRINLKITRIDVEPLKHISFNDAIAEGIEQTSGSGLVDRTWRDYSGLGVSSTYHPQDSYATLWNSIHGPGSWDLNPWVWVVEFNMAVAVLVSRPTKIL
jgi:hypothetical protein